MIAQAFQSTQALGAKRSGNRCAEKEVGEIVRKFITKVVSKWLTVQVPCCPICESMNAVRLLIVERSRTANFYCPRCDIEFDKEHIYLILQDGNRRRIA